MKIILLGVLLFLAIGDIYGQKMKMEFGTKSGVNSAIFSTTVNSESHFRTGFHLGAYVRTSIGGKWYLRPEMYYSSQGQKDDHYQPPNGQSLGSTTTTVNYLNFPIIFETGKLVTFQIGPQWGILLSGKEEGTYNNQKVDDDLKDGMTVADFAVVLGVGVHPPGKFNFGARLNYGITDIFNVDPVGFGFEYPAFQNRVFHFYTAFALYK